MVSEVMLPGFKFWVQNHGKQNCHVSIIILLWQYSGLRQVTKSAFQSLIKQVG